MQSDNVKQVIVVRKDLKNLSNGKKIRTGKLVSQSCHASNAVLLKNIFTVIWNIILYKIGLSNNTAWYKWINGSFTKIVVTVDSEAELREIYEKASVKKLPCSYIIDNGKTEFNGIKTPTCVAIGPCFDKDFVGITDKLSLL